MANNRMWLLHRPTGKAVFLGKRMAGSWHHTPEDVAERIEALFGEVGPSNDFALAMEDCSDAPFAFDGWQYTGPGSAPLTQLKVVSEGMD